jgi:hypothetical protein
MLREGVDHAAAEDVTEQLVTGLGKRHGFGFTPEVLLVHASPFAARRRGSKGVRRGI